MRECNWPQIIRIRLVRNILIAGDRSYEMNTFEQPDDKSYEIGARTITADLPCVRCTLENITDDKSYEIRTFVSSTWWLVIRNKHRPKKQPTTNHEISTLEHITDCKSHEIGTLEHVTSNWQLATGYQHHAKPRHNAWRLGVCVRAHARAQLVRHLISNCFVVTSVGNT